MKNLVQQGVAHLSNRREITSDCYRNFNFNSPLYFWARQLVCALCILSVPVTGWAQNPAPDLLSKSIEELMDVEVTSVSKKEEKLFLTAAAIYVITREDIRRSGLASIPEVLRLVPGLDVARIDGSKYAISARGFNGRFADKLLVLIDGRSIFSPETSGVWWEVQDLILEDIDRIEVIRGPGGTIWGANAVNGVISIVTRRAEETQGGLVSTGGGTLEHGFGSFRYGGKIGEKAYYRVYGKYFNNGGSVNAQGDESNDGHETLRGGARLDWQLNVRDSLTVEGDIYRTNLRENPTAVLPAAPFAPHPNTAAEFNGGNVLGRWTRVFSKQSDMALQVYYDRFSRDIYDLAERNNTFDMDFQHRIALGTRQDLVWGVGYRRLWDDTDSTTRTPVQYNPIARTVQLFSVFAQDEITVVKERLRLMFGTKVEHNDYSGVDFQPTARFLWTPKSNQTIWGAVSRAASTTARKHEDIRVNLAAFPTPDGTPAILALLGNKNVRSQRVLAYEAGYRVQPNSKLSLDVATFYNRYDRLLTMEPARPFLEVDPLPPHLIIPLVFDNLMRGTTYGAETSVIVNVTTGWRLAGSYSYLHTRMNPYLESLDTNSKEGVEGNSPQHQFQVHSHIRLPRNFEFDASFYHVSRLDRANVPSYERLDIRFGWHVAEGVEISAGAQNLLSDRHLEFAGNDVGVPSSYIRRSAYGKLVWNF